MQESGIFKTAVKLPAHERAAYLDQVCGSNAALRLEIEGLLRAHDRPGEFMFRPPIADATTILGPGPERPGMRVGPYKLLQFLGEGGMGTVFVAEQTQPIRRTVALKIVKPGMDSSQVLARFEAERQALAVMDHPNIAKVLDAGTTDGAPGASASGGPLVADPPGSPRPYFVMELVKGVPITEFCDKNKLSTRQRLELFIPVCNAIQHAHMKGIIHRDVKPSNVLIALYDGKPVPKVIDFGVAKAMAEPLTQRTLFTQIGQVVGTIEYMSPEQATLNQLDIDTRSDIYSLGVLLYELLTGMTPIDKDRLRTLAFDQMLRTIREEEPLRPSARLSSAAGALAMAAAYRGSDSQKLLGVLRGELDWIVMKCLEKERDRRFVTAAGLAQDIERYLHDEPVTACPPSLGYRLRKAYRKNKTGLTVAALCALLLLAGIAATSWQAFRATQAEDVALAKQRDAENAREAEAFQHKVAEEAKIKAQGERDAVKAAREQLRRTHYALAMNAVQNAWESDNVQRAIELLQEQQPAPGEDDLRNFEWNWWDRMCHAERSSRRIAGSHDGAFSGDGKRAAHIVYKYKEDGPDTDAPFGGKLRNGVELLVEDLATQKTARTWLFAQEPSVNSLALPNHDGSRVAYLHGGLPLKFATFERPLEVFDVASGKSLITLMAASRLIAFSADGKRLAVAGDSLRELRIYEVDRAGAVPIVLKLDPPILAFSLVFSPDGTRLAAVQREVGPPSARNCRVQLWDAGTGQTLGATELDAVCMALTFTPDGTHLVGIGDRQPGTGGLAVRNMKAPESILWQVVADGSLKLLRTTPLSVSPYRSLPTAGNWVVPSPDGQCIAFLGTGAGPNGVTLFHTDSGQHLQTFKTMSAVTHAAFSADGRLLTRNLAPGGSVIKEWDIDLNALLPGNVETRHSQDGRRQLVITRTRSPNLRVVVSVRDAAGKEIQAFENPNWPIGRAHISPNGAFVLTENRLDQATVWEADTGNIRRSATAPKPSLLLRDDQSVFQRALGAVSPDERYIVLPDEAGQTSKVYRFDDLSEVCTLGNVTLVAFSSQRLVTSNKAVVLNAGAKPRQSAGALQLWDLEAGRALPLAAAPALGAMLSPDGTRLVTVSSPDPDASEPELLMSLFDLASGTKIAAAPTSGRDIVFSQDSRTFLTLAQRQQGGKTDTAVLWDALTGKKRLTLDVGRLYPLSGWSVPGNVAPHVVFSPDNTRVVVWTATDARASVGVPTVFDLNTGAKLFRLEELAEGPSVFRNALVAFNKNGTRIATLQFGAGNQFRSLTIWDGATGRDLMQLKFPESQVFVGGTLDFSPDGHRLICKSNGSRAIPPWTMTWDARPRAEAK
jgi:serine/threonine protein kinase/WD40 repeat protein